MASLPEALSLIARAASGSMRDALSLLDQAIAHGGGKVAAAAVGDMLGAVDQTHLLRLLECITGGDAAGAASVADEMQARSLSFDAALGDLASLLLRIALAQSVPDALEDDLPERSRIVELAGRVDPESVQLYYQIALQGREDLPLAPDEHAGFLMTILRMLAFRPDGVKQSLPVAAKKAVPAAEKKAPASSKQANDWPQLVEQLAVTGAARELARNAELRGSENGTFDLVVPKAKAFLADRAHQEKLKAALEQHLGGRVTVKVSIGETSGATLAAMASSEREARQVEAVRSVKGDGFVQDLVNMFDGKVVDSTIRQKEK